MNASLEKCLSLETTPSNLQLANHIVRHHPQSGLNTLADAATHLFTCIGKLKLMKSHTALHTLQAELIEEINFFYATVKHHGFSPEYTLVSRYIMCAMLDEILMHSPLPWEPYRLLVFYNQDLEHQEKFFTILQRIIKEPALYIDLMELMYLCLSMEYKGQYRTMENGHYQLEQITNGLYKHIRAYRGSYSKILSPTPLKPSNHPSMTILKRKKSLTTIFIVTVCVILTIFISLGYRMDVSNESTISLAQNQT